MTLPITVIIVSYNSSQMLPTCIGALRKQIEPEQIIVVDNLSKDNSTTLARECRAEVIVNAVNCGFGAACNAGARAAKYDTLMFVNPDICVTSVDRPELQELIKRRPFGLLAPTRLLASTGIHGEHTMKRVWPWPCSITREALGPVVPRSVSSRLYDFMDVPGNKAWLSGAILLCSRTEFLHLGGFDETFFLYYEDQELSRRYVKHGMSISVTDAISAKHVRGGSSHATDLRPTSRAASAISSVELVGIIYGSSAVRRAWVLYQSLRRFAFIIAWATAFSPVGRRKLTQLYSTREAFVKMCGDVGPHYPNVKALARWSRR